MCGTVAPTIAWKGGGANAPGIAWKERGADALVIMWRKVVLMHRLELLIFDGDAVPQNIIQTCGLHELGHNVLCMHWVM